MRQSIIALICFSISHLAWASEQTIIHAGMLLVEAGKGVKTQHSVIIENGKIIAVEPGYSQKPSAKIIDLTQQFVMAGLMDMHVHLQGELGPDNDKDSLKMPSQLMQMRSIHFATQTLNAGFTTVRDVGSSTQEMYALRDAIEQGWVMGPRIVAAGTVGITGGHADISGISPDYMAFHDSKTHTVCDGPYDCRRATRHAIKYGADWIKITSTGGVLTDRATGTGQQMEMDELTEVVQAASRMGRKVASHAHQEDGIIAALQAGVASIEHGTYAGPESHKLFLETGAYLVPTLLAGDTVLQMAKNTSVLSESQKAKAIKVGHDMQGNFAAAVKAGVNIAFGTDSGVSKHGDNAKEAILMHQAGMPAMAILKSATVNTADLLGMSATLGTLEKGKWADIIAMPVSPLEDINALLDVSFVMKAGKVVKQP